MIRVLLLTFLTMTLAACGEASAQQRETPYWATIDTTRLNLRVGPSTEYRINWVYMREGMPIKVLRLKEGWRYIEDSDGDRGWVAKSMLSAQRGGLVVGEDLAPMRTAPADNSSLKWNLEPGVVGKLGECEAGWCLFSVEGRQGYVPSDRIYGAGEP